MDFYEHVFSPKQNSALQRSLHYSRSVQRNSAYNNASSLCPFTLVLGSANTLSFRAQLLSKAAWSWQTTPRAVLQNCFSESVQLDQSTSEEKILHFLENRAEFWKQSSLQLRSCCNTTFMVKNRRAFTLTGSTTEPNPFSIRGGAAARSSRL